MKSVYSLTLSQASSLIKKGELSSLELTQSVLDRMEALNPKINAFVTWDRKKILSQAERIDQKRTKKEKLGLLAGVPIAMKDLANVQGEQVTCCSNILKGYVSPYDATLVQKIREQDGVIFGRTNMDEFAMGSSNENSCYGPVHNPWDLERVPGGSSGGSAASVAADMTIAAIGSDTGGSIRQPASLCGIVGVKPTYGRVSRYGLVAFASSLDQFGPMTKTVEDAAILLEAVSGYDPKDSTSINQAVPHYVDFLQNDIKGKKMGIPKEFFGEGIEPDVRRSIDNALKYLVGLGVETVEISLPYATDYAIATYYILATAEASSNLARYDGVRYGNRAKAENLLELYQNTRGSGFGSEVKRRIILGTYVLSSGYYDAYYLKAQKVRTLIRQDFEKAFQKCDFIVTPTAPTVAFKLGEKSMDPLTMYLSDIYTISLNLAGLPGLSVPVEPSKNGLPIGLQILGPILGEANILNIAMHLERQYRNPNHKPKLDML